MINLWIMKKGIGEDLRKSNDIRSSLICVIHMVKVPIQSAEINRFSAILVKVSGIFFIELEKILLKIIWKHTYLSKLKQSCTIKTLLQISPIPVSSYTYYWHKKLHVGSQNKTEDREENLYFYGHQRKLMVPPPMMLV